MDTATMMALTAALLLCGGCTHMLARDGAAGHPREARVLLHESFQDGYATEFARRLIENNPNVELAEGRGPHGGNAIRVTYRGGERGSNRVVFREPLAAATEEATLVFDVMFDADFQFVRGGKLHGVGPAGPVTGGHAMEPHRWSSRAVFAPEGRVSPYLYVQNKPGQYGLTQRSDSPVFTKGRYHRVALHTRLNSAPDVADGFAWVYVDAKRVAGLDGMIFRAELGDNTLIQTFLFSTFHGGNSPAFAPTDEQGNYTNVHAYFANVTIYDGFDERYLNENR
jgi:hypothetical protein